MNSENSARFLDACRVHAGTRGATRIGAPCQRCGERERYLRGGSCTRCSHKASVARAAATPLTRSPWPEDIPRNVAERIALLPTSAERLAGYHTYRMLYNPIYAMKARARSLVAGAVARRGYTKSSPTAELLGCTWPEFARHLELQFLPGMSWANRDQWHVDHIVPMASATTEAEVMALQHFTNLRPLWGVDNLRKGARITHLL